MSSVQAFASITLTDTGKSIQPRPTSQAPLPLAELAVFPPVDERALDPFLFASVQLFRAAVGVV